MKGGGSKYEELISKHIYQSFLFFFSSKRLSNSLRGSEVFTIFFNS